MQTNTETSFDTLMEISPTKHGRESHDVSENTTTYMGFGIFYRISILLMIHDLSARYEPET